MTQRSAGTKRPRKDEEHREQVALFQWAALAEGHHPELRWLYAVPNFAKAGRRGDPKAAAAVAYRIKEGMKPGVNDIHLPVARGPYIGLWIEMKSETGTLTPAQRAWLEGMREEGHDAHVCRSMDGARRVIERYLALPKPLTPTETEAP